MRLLRVAGCAGETGVKGVLFAPLGLRMAREQDTGESDVDLLGHRLGRIFRDNRLGVDHRQPDTL